MEKKHWPEFGIIIFVDKRHCSEFGIITCFLWIKGNVLKGQCKRHCSNFGIITSVLSFVLLRVFCG